MDELRLGTTIYHEGKEYVIVNVERRHNFEGTSLTMLCYDPMMAAARRLTENNSKDMTEKLKKMLNEALGG